MVDEIMHDLEQLGMLFYKAIEIQPLTEALVEAEQLCGRISLAQF